METNLITPVSLFSPQTAPWCVRAHTHTPTHGLICCSFICIMLLSSASPHFPEIQSNNTPELNPPSPPPSPLRPPGRAWRGQAPSLCPCLPPSKPKPQHTRAPSNARSRAETRTGDLPAVFGKTLRLCTLYHAERICLCQNSKKQTLGSKTTAPSGPGTPEPGCSEPNTHPSGLH